MIVASASLQSDAAIVQQLERLATTQVVVAVSVALIALSVFAVALATLFAIRKLMRTVDRAVLEFSPKVDPLLSSVSRIAGDGAVVAAHAKERISSVLETIDDLNERLRSGAEAVEERVKKFGAVVDVVQSEAEELLLDAASTAHGVHTAAQILRADKRQRLEQGAPDTDEDLFTD